MGQNDGIQLLQKALQPVTDREVERNGVAFERKGQESSLLSSESFQHDQKRPHPAGLQATEQQLDPEALCSRGKVHWY